ncbi:uncharacterized protein YciI [Paraburkholderia sp. GAS199]|uniref:YciI family protein n=1 Tax=Paraburkholderia sp. GAS199 TaxID=3035126 RepID=UPI003D1A5160
MKFVTYIKYVDDAAKVASLRPTHREYMALLGAAGSLVAAGPFEDGSGALFIYEADTYDAALAILKADPYDIGGAFASFDMKPWKIVAANVDLLNSVD